MYVDQLLGENILSKLFVKIRFCFAKTFKKIEC